MEKDKDKAEEMKCGIEHWTPNSIKRQDTVKHQVHKEFKTY